MARHGNWVREEPAREPIQVLTQDLVDHAAAALFEHGAVSLKALRLFLQRRTSTNLISMRTGIRQLAEQTVESMTGSLDVKTLPAQGLAEIRKIAVWEPVPVDLEKHGRGRCLFHSLNDHCGESAKSWAITAMCRKAIFAGSFSASSEASNPMDKCLRPRRLVMTMSPLQPVSR
eukprot:s7361_g1.t1